MEEAVINDATASHAEEKFDAPPSESNSYNRKNNIQLSNKYLFPGQFYNIIFNFEKKCILYSITIQGNNNSTGCFLSHIMVCFYLFIKLYIITVMIISGFLSVCLKTTYIC